MALNFKDGIKSVGIFEFPISDSPGLVPEPIGKIPKPIDITS